MDTPQPPLHSVASTTTPAVALILAGVQPKSPHISMMYRLVMVIAAAQTAARILLAFLLNPIAFMRHVDRSYLDREEVLPGVVHEYITVNGVRLHVASLGRDPSKPLMLFLHGFPDSWYSWRGQLAHFKAAGYDAVALDLRGYNLSDKPQGVDAYMMDVVATDVAAAVQGLGHDSCILVGHDWGGLVASVAAAMYPERVQRLILLATFHPALSWLNSTYKQLWKSLYVLVFQVRGLAELGIRHSDFGLLDQLLAGKPGFSRKDVEVYKHALSKPGALTGGLQYYRALFKWATWPGGTHWTRLWDVTRRQLTMPVLVIMGADDAYIEPTAFGGLDQLAAVSEQHVIPGAGHWLHNERPETIHTLMGAFLSVHPPSPSARSSSS